MMRKTIPDTMLFDLDGTLLDSIGGVRLSLAYVIEKHAPRSSLTADHLVSHVGRPLTEILALLEGETDVNIDVLVREYLTHNQRLIPSLPLFDDVPALIRRLRDGGVRLGIVTSKRRDSAEISIKRHRLDRDFEVILTSNDSTRHKPHPEPLLKALEKLGSEASRAAYVGDAVFDVQAAHAAGCISVAALWGTVHEVKLLGERPHHICPKPLDVLSLLTEAL